MLHQLAGLFSDFDALTYSCNFLNRTTICQNPFGGEGGLRDHRARIASLGKESPRTASPA